MYFISVKFIFGKSQTNDNDELKDLLRSLKDNGQLIEFFQYSRNQKEFEEYFAISLERDSLDSKYFNSNTVKRINKLASDSIRMEFEVNPSQELNVANQETMGSEFVLYYGGGSPIRSIKDFSMVPLYFFPKTSRDGTNYFDIISWESNYEAVYSLWFSGGFDEEYFYNQLSNFKSGLSQLGLQICKQLHDLTKKTFYYYLFRYPESNSDRTTNNCPSCGRPWKLKEKLFEVFEYKCPFCLLIS